MLSGFSSCSSAFICIYAGSDDAVSKKIPAALTCKTDFSDGWRLQMEYGTAIRKADVNDLSRIAEIQVFNYRLYFYPIFKSNEYFFNELRVPSLMQEYESGLDSLYVYDDGVVKGFIKIEGTYIARLFVEPVLQNASVGSRLLEYAVKEHNADHLWVLEKNAKAIRFYKRHGFAANGEKKLEDGTSEYLVLLKRNAGTVL